jgi:flavin reductase (DIM6/NTAB) family NADH-FMN oxidoreductase RutF
MKHFSAETISGLDDRFRRNLINSLHGVRPALLIGTASSAGNQNLAVFSQILHIGANPPLTGILFRPDSVDRHTLTNIRETGFFTINTATTAMAEQVHQTSARYHDGVSEFEQTGLTPAFTNGFQAPFVAESPVKIALQLVEEHPIERNGTILVIGQILHIFLREDILEEDGFVAHQKADSLAVAGLDAYFGLQNGQRFSYAKPDQPIRKTQL